MSSQDTLNGIQRFFNNDELSKYPTLEYSIFTDLKRDLTYLRIWEASSKRDVIQIHRGSLIRIYLL